MPGPCASAISPRCRPPTITTSARAWHARAHRFRRRCGPPSSSTGGSTTSNTTGTGAGDQRPPIWWRWRFHRRYHTVSGNGPYSHLRGFAAHVRNCGVADTLSPWHGENDAADRHFLWAGHAARAERKAATENLPAHATGRDGEARPGHRKHARRAVA